MATSLRYPLMLVRSLEAAKEFYVNILGLSVLAETPSILKLDGGPVPIVFKQSDSESSLTSGYTPILVLNVSELDFLLPVLLQQGAFLDGPIRYQVQGKVAMIRTPDGHMLSLFERSDFTKQVEDASNLAIPPQEGEEEPKE